MKKIKIGLLGAGGRMGQEIKKLIAESDDLDLFLSVTRERECDSNQAKMVDVWIDFTSPSALADNLKLALDGGKAFVCGTTGFGENETRQLEAAAKKIPVLWSANMSLGITVLTEALKVFSRLHEFDFQVEELHHVHKKDKPSGTALALQKSLQEAVGRKLPDPVAIRGGGIFGVHKILAMSAEETISFEHTALNRAVFARGALQASRWLLNRKPGLYSMQDCLFGTSA